jgi:hypothetical protein
MVMIMIDYGDDDDDCDDDGDHDDDDDRDDNKDDDEIFNLHMYMFLVIHQPYIENVYKELNKHQHIITTSSLLLREITSPLTKHMYFSGMVDTGLLGRG